MISFTGLTAENFMAFKTTVKIPLNTLKGKVLISGKNSTSGHYKSNGAGKTTILEALIWSIFGESLRGLSPSEVINWNTKRSSAKVSLDFTKDSDTYQITRIRSKSKSSLVLVKNGKDISARLDADTQTQIEEVIGVEKKVLFNSIFIESGMAGKFSTLKLGAQYALIESVLLSSYDFNKVTKFALGEKSKAKTVLDQGEGSLQVHKANLEAAMEQLGEEGIAGLTKRISEFKKTKEGFSSNLHTESSKLPKLTSKVKDLQKNYDLLNGKLTQVLSQEKDIERLKTQIQEHVNYLEKTRSDNTSAKQAEKAQAAIPELERSISTTNGVISDLSTELNGKVQLVASLTRQSQSHDFINGQLEEKAREIQNYKDEIETAKSSDSIVCDLCGRPTESPLEKSKCINKVAEKRLKAEKEWLSLQDQLAEVPEPPKSFPVLIKEAQDELANLKETLALNQNNLSVWTQDLEAKRVFISQVQEFLTNIKNTELSKKRLNESLVKSELDLKNLGFTSPTLQLEQNHISETLETARSSLNSCEVKITELRKDIEIVEGKIFSSEEFKENTLKLESQIKDKLDALATANESLELYDFWYKQFAPKGTIRVKILEEGIKFISQRLVIYSDVLMGSPYEILLDDKNRLVITSNSGPKYKSLSSGQKRRLDIAIQLSFHDYVVTYCGIKFNLIFMDEIFDTMDETGFINVVQLLQAKIDYCKLDTIYIITHVDQFKGHFDQEIIVEKDTAGNSLLQGVS